MPKSPYNRNPPGSPNDLDVLNSIVVDDAVRSLRPDFAALLMIAEGIVNGPSDDGSAAWLATATRRAAAPDDDEHVLAWREAYRGFGAKPKRTKPSIDGLLGRGRRGDALPAINRVVDAYNAVSVEHILPVGGEDIEAYVGPARLIRATGDEPFDTVSGGAEVVEHPLPGEVVWRDDAGVTCRRWNWRQCVRTRITETTKDALFILERLEPYPIDRLIAAGDDLAGRLRALAPDVRIETRLVGPTT